MSRNDGFAEYLLRLLVKLAGRKRIIILNARMRRLVS